MAVDYLQSEQADDRVVGAHLPQEGRLSLGRRALPRVLSYLTCFAAHSAGGSCEASFARYTAPNPPSPSLRPRLTRKWPIWTIDMLAILGGFLDS